MRRLERGSGDEPQVQAEAGRRQVVRVTHAPARGSARVIQMPRYASLRAERLCAQQNVRHVQRTYRRGRQKAEGMVSAARIQHARCVVTYSAPAMSRPRQIRRGSACAVRACAGAVRAAQRRQFQRQVRVNEMVSGRD